MANGERQNRVTAYAVNITHPGSSPATIVNASTGILPKNAIIRKIYHSHTAEIVLQGNARWDWILVSGPCPAANVAPVGLSIFGPINPGGNSTAARIDGGGTATDLPIYAGANAHTYLEPDYYIEDEGFSLILTVRKSAVSIFNIVAIVYLERLDAPVGPDQPIIPRGTEEEPVCVKICGGEPTPEPPLPPEPPPQPPPPGPTHVDVLQEPLPPISSIDPLFPLEAVGRLCDAP